MTRLLAFGFCPLPFENTEKTYGPGIRIWQFIQPILGSNHEICLITERIPGTYSSATPNEIILKKENCIIYNLAPERYRDTTYIQNLHDDFKPDAILCATIFSLTPFFQLKTTAPIWIDLFGHVMAEAQAKAFRYRDNSFLSHYWKYEILALSLGDIFSTVSTIQEAATIGELGLLGRLTSETTGYRFCRTIPCAMEEGTYVHEKNVFRGDAVPDDAFVVLWSGGYNTWTDIDTLFEGLDSAMNENPRIWFVSTGGEIIGHDEITYPSFLKKISRSKSKTRYVMKGWVPKEDVHNYYFESNIGINIDHFMYEGLFGSKNRVLDWMRAGLPALIGELCELSKELPAQKLAYSFPLHNAKALKSILVQLSYNEDSVRETGIRALEYGQKHLNFRVTTKAFREWLDKPWKSPDHKNQKSSFLIQTNYFDVYTKKLEQELFNKNKHIKELETYIRKLENEFSKDQKTILKTLKSDIEPVEPLHIPDNPKISVVVVSWNGEKYIENCLSSVLEDNYSNIEYIIIDNGSSDKTLNIISQQFPTVNLTKLKKNIGFSKGVNIGLKKASGDIILLINQDVIINKGLLFSIVDTFKSDPLIGIVGCKIYSPDGTIQHAGGILHKNGLTDHIGAGEKDHGQYDIVRECDYVTGAVFAINRKLIEKIGVLDERFSPAYFEELDFCFRARRLHYKIIYNYSGTAIHYESTSTGKFSNRFYYLYHRNRLFFMLKHFTCKYIIRTFLPSEINWIRKAHPRDQFSSLIKAYTRVSPRFVWIFIRDFIKFIKRR